MSTEVLPRVLEASDPLVTTLKIQRGGFTKLDDGTFVRTPKVRVTCAQCSTQFIVYLSAFRKGEGKFCSMKCYGKANAK